MNTGSSRTTTVPLSKIKSNPWRDLNLYPIDSDQVAKLVASINEHGFYGGVKARPVGDHYELGFGHHRIEAAKRAGLTAVAIVIDDMNDDQMIQLMCAENATQSGAVAAAVMNEVAAATKRIAGVVMRHEHLSTVVDRSVADLFDSAKAYDTARGNITSGDGIGEATLTKYLRNNRASRALRTSISALKKSGVYLRIVKEIEAEINAEAEAAQSAAREAQRDEAKRQKSAAAAKAQQAAAAAAKHSEKAHPKILDERCASVFKTKSQFAAFKDAVTSVSGQQYIGIDQQLPLAQKIMRDVADSKHLKPGVELIREPVQDIIRHVAARQSPINQQHANMLLAQATRDATAKRAKELSASLGHVITHGVHLRDRLKKFPDHVYDPFVQVVTIRVGEAMDILTELEKMLGGNALGDIMAAFTGEEPKPKRKRPTVLDLDAE